MSWDPPPPGTTWQAIHIYLPLAYPGEPPLAVRARLEALRNCAPADFYRTPAFEHVPAIDPTRLSLRLGNQFYPHMKLVIERAPHGAGALFHADTHDRHVQLRPDSPEAGAFANLTAKNQQLAALIETAWDEHGLPTFKRYLREDLARRTTGKA